MINCYKLGGSHSTFASLTYSIRFLLAYMLVFFCNFKQRSRLYTAFDSIYRSTLAGDYVAQRRRKIKRCSRAVETGPAGPALARPILHANENSQLYIIYNKPTVHYCKLRQEFIITKLLYSNKLTFTLKRLFSSLQLFYLMLFM